MDEGVVEICDFREMTTEDTESTEVEYITIISMCFSLSRKLIFPKSIFLNKTEV
jgi:hypothetical protein